MLHHLILRLWCEVLSRSLAEVDMLGMRGIERIHLRLGPILYEVPGPHRLREDPLPISMRGAVPLGVTIIWIVGVMERELDEPDPCRPEVSDAVWELLMVLIALGTWVCGVVLGQRFKPLLIARAVHRKVGSCGTEHGAPEIWWTELHYGRSWVLRCWHVRTSSGCWLRCRGRRR